MKIIPKTVTKISFFIDGTWHDFAVDRVTRPVLNAQQHAEKMDLPIIVWWTPFTGEKGRIKKCFVGNCFLTENRTLATHSQLNAFLFYGTDFKVEDIPLPRKSNYIRFFFDMMKDRYFI